MPTPDENKSTDHATSTLFIQCIEAPSVPAADGPQEHSSPDKTRAASDWLLWQLADSAFPTGGFVHSGGLEAACQHSEIRGGAALASFIEASLWQMGNGSLPFVAATYDRPEALDDIDNLCRAYLSNHVANRSSCLQGRALLSSVERIFGASDTGHLLPARAAKPRHCHFAPVFGWITWALGVDRQMALRLFLFVHLRSLISSAVRLGIVGPLEAQALQNHLSRPAEEILLACENLSIDDIAQTAPLLDIWQATQDRLYSRLFQS